MQNIVKNDNRSGWRGWNRRNKRLFQIERLSKPVVLTDGTKLNFLASNGDPDGFIWATDLNDLDRMLGQ